MIVQVHKVLMELSLYGMGVPRLTMLAQMPLSLNIFLKNRPRLPTRRVKAILKLQKLTHV